MIDKCELSFSHDGRTTTVIYDGQPLKNIKSVWYRRPYVPERDDLNVLGSHKDYAYTAVRKHMLDLYGMFQDAFWLSDYCTILKAEMKPRQLELAARIGFRTPKTLSTSHSKAASDFLKRTGDSVAKSMATTLPIVNAKVQYFYTTMIPSGKQVDLGGLHLGPAIFQEAIDVDRGLRVTVVGHKVFAAAVRDKNHYDYPDITDWRRAYTSGELHFEAFELPKDLEAKCVELTKALNLQFGAIDLLLDKKGRFWFLEINPNGQWAFVEDDTGQPIGKAVAELLERGGV
jgi:glutathione synthase/RimK-type ligase-like ATP-grasp enzyme